MPKYQYSFEINRIESCNKCPFDGVGVDWEPCCKLDDNIGWSDISRPNECPLQETKCK